MHDGLQKSLNEVPSLRDCKSRQSRFELNNLGGQTKGDARFISSKSNLRLLSTDNLNDYGHGH
jgi:hypothetical protein